MRRNPEGEEAVSALVRNSAGGVFRAQVPPQLLTLLSLWLFLPYAATAPHSGLWHSRSAKA